MYMKVIVTELQEQTRVIFGFYCESVIIKFTKRRDIF